MAVALENSQLVWQKVKNALANANPTDREAFRALRAYLSTQGRNPDLQFIAYSEADSLVAAGTDMVGAACTLYGWYGKAKRTTGTTSAFIALHAAATANASTTTLDTVRIKATGQTFSVLHSKGQAVETGLTINAATAVGGQTESTTPDGADGFVVIGAA